MSDTNLTLSPEQAPVDPDRVTLPERGAKTTPFLMIAGAGLMVLLLCVGLFIGGGRLIGPILTPAGDGAAISEGKTGALIETAFKNAKPVLTVLPEAQPGSAEAVLSEDEVDMTGQDMPEIGRITFGMPGPGQPATGQPNFAFEAGATQIQATFEYAHLQPENTWTQVWYHNGYEVSSISQPWLEGDSGVYEYLIETGGEPLPAGQWALELYIDDELLMAGSFMIEGAEDNLAAAERLDLADLPRTYRLAYTKWNGEKHDLYVGDTNGSQEQFIMSRAAGPSWSADGRHLFFYGEEGVDQQPVNGGFHPLPGVTNGIARLNAAPLPAGPAQLQLFQGHGWNDGTARYANVAPDGSMIAYDGDRGGGRRIYFLGTAANQQFRYEIIGEQASWSPDSQQIVYRSGRDNKTGIWISNRTDSGHIQITGGGTDSFPTWSPDGQTIAFSRDVGGNVDIYSVNIDGSNLTRLTDAPGHDTLPVYLPNGDLVFRSARSGSWGIWKMKVDGSNQTEIISNAPVGPDWAFSRMGVLR